MLIDYVAALVDYKTGGDRGDSAVIPDNFVVKIDYRVVDSVVLYETGNAPGLPLTQARKRLVSKHIRLRFKPHAFRT